MAGVNLFELYRNLLSDETRQPWEKIIKAQVTSSPCEDMKGVTHLEAPTKTWDSFNKCVTFHLLRVFRHDVGEALKYYITNTLKKPNWVSIRQFFIQVEQLNCYLETLPCLFNSPKANQATKRVLPLDDADLTTHLLRMCPAKWQTQYNLTENSIPVSTRALLLVLENIENNVELDTKPTSTTKARGLNRNARWSRRTPASPRSLRNRAGPRSTACYARSMGADIKCITPVTVDVIRRTVILLRKMGTQASPLPKKGSQKA